MRARTRREQGAAPRPCARWPVAELCRLPLYSLAVIVEVGERPLERVEKLVTLFHYALESGALTQSSLRQLPSASTMSASRQRLSISAPKSDMSREARRSRTSPRRDLLRPRRFLAPRHCGVSRSTAWSRTRLIHDLRVDDLVIRVRVVRRAVTARATAG